MRINYFLIISLLLFLFACNHNKINKFYYDSGELRHETHLIDKQKQIYYRTFYYRNGAIEAEGTVLEDGEYLLPNGEWKEYFSDGALKWSGERRKGDIVISKTEKMPDFVRLPIKLEIEGMPKILKVGETYKIRTFVEGIHPSIYDVLVSYPDSRAVRNREDSVRFFVNIPKNEEDPDRFPFVVRPKVAGEMYIRLVFPDEEGRVIFGIDDTNLSFVYEVVE